MCVIAGKMFSDTSNLDDGLIRKMCYKMERRGLDFRKVTQLIIF
jgi:hypothetical protein